MNECNSHRVWWSVLFLFFFLLTDQSFYYESIFHSSSWHVSWMSQNIANMSWLHVIAGPCFTENLLWVAIYYIMWILILRKDRHRWIFQSRGTCPCCVLTPALDIAYVNFKYASNKYKFACLVGTFASCTDCNVIPDFLQSKKLSLEPQSLDNTSLKDIFKAIFMWQDSNQR